jgi:hypothetical protein
MIEDLINLGICLSIEHQEFIKMQHYKYKKENGQLNKKAEKRISMLQKEVFIWIIN